MNLSRPFILRPVATTLLMVALLLTGALAYRQLPVSALPQVDYPTIQVVTFYPGASPEVMGTSVTAPLERQFGQMPGLVQMSSSSSGGSSLITLQFSLELNLDVAEQQVQAAINSSFTLLPKDLPSPPAYSKVNPADAPVLTLALSSDTLPLPRVEDLAETRLSQKIAQLPGVGLVSISGGQRPAIRVQANPDALAAYGLTLEDLRTALAAANVNQAKGNLDGPRRAFTIAANDQLLSSRDYRSLVVAYRGGAPVLLTDLADVSDGAENVRQAAWAGASAAVVLNVQRQPGANVIEVVDRVRALLPRLEASLPPSVRLTALTDRTTTIRAAVADVEVELVMAVALVVLVIFLFLRTAAATLIPSIAVPLSLVGTLGVIYLLGFSLNNLTLMALTIATGFVVDDAIVMIENIVRHLEEGELPLQAALRGSREIGFTLVSLTVSLVAVLIPLLFMGDVVGRLFREFAITLSVTIGLSLAISLTLTPMMCSRLLRPHQNASENRLQRQARLVLERVTAAYGRSLSLAIAARRTTLVVALVTLVLTVGLYILVPKGFFPSQDTGLLVGITEAPASVSFAAMAEHQQALARLVSADPAVESLSSFIGVDGTNTTLNSGRLLVNLKPQAQRRASAREVMNRINQASASYPAAQLYLQPAQDLTVESRVSRTQFQYTLQDADAQELETWAPRLLETLRALPQLRSVASDRQDGGLQANLGIDRVTAARLGVTPQMVNDTLYDAFGQRQVSTVYTQLNQYRVILEVKPRYRLGPEALSAIYVRPPGAAPVPLGAFTQLRETNALLVQNHQDQFPAATLSFNLAPGVALGEAVRAIDSAAAGLGLPPGLRASFQGTAQAFQAALINEPLLILAALITVYIVLGVLYESFVHPLTILSTLPSAGLGALLALIILGGELDVIAFIGIILLIGIVKKNAIMMIDVALELKRTRRLDAAAAIHAACLLRLRPILMTTFAAMLGAMPLALSAGVGAELRRPLGIAIVGGLIVSQILTLYTTPVIYLYLDRLIPKRQRRSPEAVATP